MSVENNQNYDYLELMIDTSFNNLRDEIDNQKKHIKSNIKKLLNINKNNFNTEKVLEKIKYNNNIYYLDNEENLIYNTEAVIIGEIKDKKYNFYL